MRDLVLTYLRAVFPHGSNGFFAVCSSAPGAKAGGMISRHFGTSDLESATEYILAEDARGYNVYVTLCAHGEDLGPKRGKRDQKVSGAVLWVDVDRKGPGHVASDLPETLLDLNTILKGIEFEPSFIVDTGGGWHCYWKFTAPVDIRSREARDEFQDVAKMLQKRLGEVAAANKWHLDGTHDLTRVLRPTGTRNHKPGRADLPIVTFLIKPPLDPVEMAFGETGPMYDYRLFAKKLLAPPKVNAIEALFGPRAAAAVADPDTIEAPGAAAVEGRPLPASGTELDGETTARQILDHIKRNGRPERKAPLEAFANGKPWAKKGERDAMAQRLVSWLAFYTGGQGSIEMIMRMAEPSLLAMDLEAPGVTEEWFEEKLVRAMNEARQKTAIARETNERQTASLVNAFRSRFEPSNVPKPTNALPKGAPAPLALLPSTDSQGAPQGAPSSAAPSMPADEAAKNPTVGERSADGVETAGCAPAAPTGGAIAGPFEGQSVALAIVPPAPAAAASNAAIASTYYERSELEAAADDQSALSGTACSLYDLRSRFVIQKGETFYVLKKRADGFWRYGAELQRGELDKALVDDLRGLPESIPLPPDPETGKAPDEGEPFFSWHEWKADGTPRKKTVKEVLATLSTVARGEVIYDLRIPRSYYDPRTETFYVAACPVRNLDPEFDPQIDEWLRTFGESEADTAKWLDFCATLTDLRYPTCGVFLSGPPGTGKTAFAQGAAKLWADQFTEMDNVFSSFNSGLSSCPLIVADESLPTDQSGRTVSTKLLRRLIGSDRRSLRRKYMSEATIVGAVRCLFLANNEDMIGQGDESLGADALEAVAGRFLHIKVTERSRDYLLKIGGRAGGTKDWVDGNKIARHLLWLRDNREVKYGARFIVDGHESKVSQLLATNGLVPGLVCEWLARFLAAPREHMLRNRHVVLGNGQFWINAQALLDAWGDIIKSDRTPPTLPKINKALSGISYDRDGSREIAANGKRLRYWKIRPEVILRYAEANQIGDDIEVMRGRIEGPEKEFTGTAVSAVFGNTPPTEKKAP